MKLVKPLKLGPVPESSHEMVMVSPAVYIVLRVGVVNSISANARGSTPSNARRKRISVDNENAGTNEAQLLGGWVGLGAAESSVWLELRGVRWLLPRD